MPPEFLITSTGKPGDFLSGALLTGFTRQWNQTPCVEGSVTLDTTNLIFNWQQDSPGAKFAHSVVLSTTAGLPSYDKSALLRTMGHLLISAMPEEGLTETLEGLAENYVYWCARTSKLSELSQPTSSFYEATIGPSYERPVFHVTEE